MINTFIEIIFGLMFNVPEILFMNICFDPGTQWNLSAPLLGLYTMQWSLENEFDIECPEHQVFTKVV